MSKVPNVITLDALPIGQHGTVVHLAPSGEHAADTGVDVSRRLMELGFVPGERIRILKRALPGGYPLAVKIGQSTFALRRFEAALVSVAAE